MNAEFQNTPIIDAHLHLWDVERMDYPWLDDEPAIKKTFVAEDYQRQTKGLEVDKMVFVQCECRPGQYLTELEFVAEQVLKDDRIKAIVAYAPLEKGNEIKRELELFSANPLIKGVRRMYGDSPGLCTSPSFLAALQLLPDYSLSFDISINPGSVDETVQMIKACPDTLFILDHLAKPDIKNHSFEEFRKNISRLSDFPNVSAKISGLITGADRENWEYNDLAQYIDYAIECFGFERLMFGSDWPVVLLAGSYQRWLEALFKYMQPYSDHERHQLFYATANSIYRL